MRREIFSEMEGKPQFCDFMNDERVNRVIEMLYTNNKDRTLRDFPPGRID